MSHSHTGDNNITGYEPKQGQSFKVKKYEESKHNWEYFAKDYLVLQMEKQTGRWPKLAYVADPISGEPIFNKSKEKSLRRLAYDKASVELMAQYYKDLVTKVKTSVKKEQTPQTGATESTTGGTVLPTETETVPTLQADESISDKKVSLPSVASGIMPAFKLPPKPEFEEDEMEVLNPYHASWDNYCRIAGSFVISALKEKHYHIIKGISIDQPYAMGKKLSEHFSGVTGTALRIPLEEFEGLTIKPHENIELFHERLDNVLVRLRELKNPKSEPEIVAKIKSLMRAPNVKEYWAQLLLNLNAQSLDPHKDVSYEELKAKMRLADEPRRLDKNNRAMQHVAARSNNTPQKECKFFKKGICHKGDHCKYRHSGSRSGRRPQGNSNKDRKCFNCQKPGHAAHECRQNCTMKKCKAENANHKRVDCPIAKKRYEDKNSSADGTDSRHTDNVTA